MGEECRFPVQEPHAQEHPGIVISASVIAATKPATMYRATQCRWSTESSGVLAEDHEEQHVAKDVIPATVMRDGTNCDSR